MYVFSDDKTKVSKFPLKKCMKMTFWAAGWIKPCKSKKKIGKLLKIFEKKYPQNNLILNFF